MAGIAALAGLFFGYDTGVISGAILFIKDQYALFSGLEEIVVSVVLVGVGSFTAPLYISEVSPANVRGALVSFNQLAITCGIVFSYIIDYSLSGHQGWRWMFAAGIIPAIV
ncbi:MAG: MFS transporter [Candidatus Omnitrophica bacterium]|nr:MFS transporter [Candidatus Omnitrophota bacterium]